MCPRGPCCPNELDELSEYDTEVSNHSDFEMDDKSSKDLQLFTQAELMILYEILTCRKMLPDSGSRLIERHLLAAGTSYSWYSSREQEFTQFFSMDFSEPNYKNIYFFF